MNNRYRFSSNSQHKEDMYMTMYQNDIYVIYVRLRKIVQYKFYTFYMYDQAYTYRHIVNAITAVVTN